MIFWPIDWDRDMVAEFIATEGFCSLEFDHPSCLDVKRKQRITIWNPLDDSKLDK